MARKPTMQVTYKTIIYYELDYDTRTDYSDAIDRMTDGLWKATQGYSVERSSNSGGPCWGPYFEMEADSLESLQVGYNAAVRYLQRWKGAIIS